jgi:RND family efflux transporter MFP subunit
VGDGVSKGAAVATIDCRDAQTDLAQAKAELAASRASNQFDQSQLATARKLSASNSISSEEIDKRRAGALASTAQVDKAAALVEKAELAVNRCELRAPFNAVVVDRLASVGDFVSRGTPVLQLLDTDSTELSARIQEADLASLQAASAHFFDSQGESYTVALRTVVPVMESRLRSYETRFVFAGNGTAPGSAGRLRWVSPRPHVPAEFLVQKDALGIFVVEDGKAVFVALPEARAGRPAPVDPDLRGEVIADGRFNVNHGDPVRIERP